LVYLEITITLEDSSCGMEPSSGLMYGRYSYKDGVEISIQNQLKLKNLSS